MKASSRPRSVGRIRAGASPRQVSDRADRVITRLLGYFGTTALFSHGHFSSALAVCWITLDMGAGEHFWLDTASISILGHHPSRPQTRILARWNIVPQSRS
jgi:broad specificity phosphatase PhoE